LTLKFSSKNHENYVDSFICQWALSNKLFEEEVARGPVHYSMLASRAACATPFSSLPNSIESEEERRVLEKEAIEAGKRKESHRPHARRALSNGL